MKTLILQLPSNRQYAGTLSIGDGSAPITAVGTCDSDFEGHEPKLGSSKLKQINLNKQATNEELFAAYGPAVLVFEAVSGEATRVSNTPDDRNILAIHAGETDDDDNLLPTNGSIRISNGDMVDLLNYIGRDKIVSLDIEERKWGMLARAVAPLVAVRASKEVFIAPTPTPWSNHTSSSGFNPWFWLWVYDSMSSSNHHAYQDVPGFHPGEGRSGGGGADASLDTVGVAAQHSAPPSTEAATATADVGVAPPPVIVDPFVNDGGTNQPPSSTEVESPAEPPAGSDRSGFTSEPEHSSSY